MEELFTLLLAKLKTVPKIKNARIYNSQTANLSKEQAVIYPCVYVELANVRALSRPGLEIQDYSATLRLRVTNYSVKQGTSYEIYKIKDQVHQYLNYFTGGGMFQPLRRTGEILSYNHDNLYEYQMEYALAWKDLTPPVEPEPLVTITDLTLRTDLDIDNPVIRTGDNQGYSF